MISTIFGVLFSLSAYAQFPATESCVMRCANQSPVKIDVAAQCMCVDDKCFKVGIGKNGPQMTYSGVGKLKPTPPGEKYKTYPTDSIAYDNDGIAMGIDGNDVDGKWLHKPANCVPAEPYGTKGCIAVPCDMWPLLKQAMRDEKELTVCNGKQATMSISNPRDNGDTTVDK
ncbi:MAG: hypothetical protein IT287_02250 [Bdellovibrionaceae bacterium]|nr:hypothetical protein [Pseudobdellovibrionaceae bacterium]